MITLEIYSARTYFSGPKSELKVMLRILRIKDKQGFWKQRFLLRKFGYLNSSKEGRKKLEQITEQAQWTKFYNLKSKSFASGLLKRVTKHLDSKGIIYDKKEHRRKLGTFKPITAFHFKTENAERRKEQIDAVNTVLAKKHGILHMSTNSGKTECAIAVVAELERQLNRTPRILYLVHRISLAQQTKNRFQKNLDIKCKMIGAGKHFIPKKGVLCATVQTASNALYNKRIEMLNFLNKCDAVFIDEFHQNSAKTVQQIMDNCSAPMRIGLSGTINTKNKKKYLAFVGMTGPVISEVRNEKLIKLGRSAKPYIRFRIIPEYPQLTKLSYRNAYEQGVINHELRNSLVIEEVLRYLNKGLRVLVMVSRISHGWNLVKLLEKATDVPLQYITGSTPLELRNRAMKKFTNGKVPILISSPILDTGVDLPSIDACVFAGAGLSWELTLQKLGRTLRRKEGKNQVFLTDFLDYHNRFLEKHSRARLKYYKQEKIENIRIIQDDF